MVMGPASCPAKMYCTAVFALRNGRFRKETAAVHRKNTAVYHSQILIQDLRDFL